jgi:TetR/AcrR family acrAB operon transcriptional repressor
VAEPTHPTATLGKGAAKALATRTMLVDLAADLFSQQGYLETSIRDVARLASLTTGAIYGHFRNKADLLVEAINNRMAEELESQSRGPGDQPDYIETLARLARDYPKRRRLRALILQGAAAAQTDDAMRERLREEQLAHLTVWIEGYRRERSRQGIHPSVDIEAMVLYTWAVELGLGVLEAVGIEPKSRKGWADIHNRMGRGMQLPPDNQERAARRDRSARRS